MGWRKNEGGKAIRAFLIISPFLLISIDVTGSRLFCCSYLLYSLLSFKIFFTFNLGDYSAILVTSHFFKYCQFKKKSDALGNRILNLLILSQMPSIDLK